MKKELITPIFFIVLLNTICAQSISNQVFASSGKEYLSNYSSLNWTLGETFIGSFEIKSGIQTLGFHQNTSRKLPAVVASLDKEIKVFPNPFLNEVFIHSTTDMNESVIQLLAPTGQLLYSKNLRLSNLYQLNLSNLSNGIYYLKIISEKDFNFKILKKSN